MDNTREVMQELALAEQENARLLRKIAELEEGVIRCKDCKHFYRYGEKWGVCEYTREHQEKALDVTPEHFCGWAEKKEVLDGQFKEESSTSV